MSGFAEGIAAFFNNRWLVFVASMWIQSCAGIGYLFGSISPVIKGSLHYNQRQIARLGVAKDLGDSVGFLAGSLSEVLPLWAALLVGAIQNFLGYGWVWLVVTGRSPLLPLWAMCVLIFIGTNGETYLNTGTLVSCVQNFPKSRGPVVGILKGFAGLGGAILTQVYAVFQSSTNPTAIILMVAVVPTLVVFVLMFIIRPVAGHKQNRPSDNLSFSIIYTVCLILASYLMAVMLIQDLVQLSHTVITVFNIILLVILLIPIIIPITLSASEESRMGVEEVFLPEPQKQGANDDCFQDIIFSEIEDEKPRGVDLLPALERIKRLAELQAKVARAVAAGAVRIKKTRRPRRGEDFTLAEALIKADFWLMFFSLLLGSGSGLTVIDNLGQMSGSLGYDNAHVFVSMISIWNFLGRVGGGYFSEIIVGEYAYPRPVAMAGAQLLMAVGHFFFAMGWPGAMYLGTLLVGLGYGAHWAIVPAAASELFGLKKFGAIYNFLTLANPAGSLVFSGVIASSIYDLEAEKQAHGRHSSGPGLLTSFTRYAYLHESHKCEGSICFFLTYIIMSVLCIIACVLSMVLVHRTKRVYANLYGKSSRMRLV